MTPIVFHNQALTTAFDRAGTELVVGSVSLSGVDRPPFLSLPKVAEALV